MPAHKTKRPVKGRTKRVPDKRLILRVDKCRVEIWEYADRIIIELPKTHIGAVLQAEDIPDEPET